MGEYALSKIQAGLESALAKGTPVAADTMLLAAPISIDPDRAPHYPQDVTGLRVRSARSHIYEYLVRNTLSFDADHPAYFQALPLLFSLGLKGAVTPTEVTAQQADWLWTFTPSLTADNAPDTATLEVGDNVRAYECEHLMIERYRIAGQINQDGGNAPVTIEADFFARQLTATDFTAALTIPATEIMNAKLAQFYLNPSWATVGATEKTGLLREFAIEILTGIHPKFHGSSSKTFNTYGENMIGFMANFVFEGNADADLIWDAMNSQILQVARLKITGAVIGTGTAHSMILDLGGTWQRVVPMSAQDRGNNLHAAILQDKYDATGAKVLALTVTTNVAAI